MPGHRSMPRGNLAHGIAVAATFWVTNGHAAGGQFAVDDAAILDRIEASSPLTQPLHRLSHRIV